MDRFQTVCTHRRTIRTLVACLLVACAAAAGIAADDEPAYRPVELDAKVIDRFDALLVNQGANRRQAEQDELEATWKGLDVPGRQAMLWGLMHRKVELEDRWYWTRFSQHFESLGADAAPVVLAALGDGRAKVRVRACRVAGEVGFKMQGPRGIDPRFEAVIAELVARSTRDAEVSVRLAALEAVGRFHQHPAGHAHELAAALADADPKVRKEAAETLSESGPVAAAHFEAMMAAFDPANNRADAEAVGRVCENIGYIPMDVALVLIDQIGRLPDSKPDPSWLAYPLDHMGAALPVRDALLRLKPMRFRDATIGYWLKHHVDGDERFVEPLVEALEIDWKTDDPKRESSCHNTESLLAALLEAGRNDKAALAVRMRRRLRSPMPTDARLLYSAGLARLTGDGATLAQAIGDTLREGKQNATSYTDNRLVAVLEAMPPGDVARLRDDLPRLEAMVVGAGQGGSAASWVATGRIEPVLEWARADLSRTRTSGIVSSVVGSYGVGDAMGPMLAPLRDELRQSLIEGSDYTRHSVCETLIAMGPDPLIGEQRQRLVEMARTLTPARRVEPAVTLWSGLHDTDAALGLLMPLLEDQSWATTNASATLGRMGRDAEPALGALRRLAAGPNPAYAQHAAMAVVTIVADMRSEPGFDELWTQLGDDDPMASLRALWRLVDRGGDTAALIGERLERGDRTMQPGRWQRLEARARQVLEQLGAPVEVDGDGE